MTQEPKSPSKTATFQRLLEQLGGIAQAVLAALLKVSGNLLQSAGKLWWNTILPFVQGLLPAPWNQRLSKPVLTGITIALLTLMLWLTSTLSRPAVSSSVRESPAPSTEAPRAPQSTAARPESALSPEKLIRIQEKLAQVAEPYGEALILSVQPKVRHHLTLTLDDRWYALPPESQDQLARQLWERSRQLDFTQFEILDLEDQRIARSPVVGQQMLILKRVGRLPAVAPPIPEEAIEPLPEPVLEPTSTPTLEPGLDLAPEPILETEPSL
jgi:hypothetical protein